MLAGELYDCGDPELITRWHEAKRIQKQYADTPSTEIARLRLLLEELFGSVGEGVWVTAPIFVDYGENVHLGKNVEINMNCVLLDCNRIEIGDHSGLGPGVHIYAVTHPTDPQQRLQRCSASDHINFWRCYSAPVIIGRNVWLGGGCIVLPGVTIGDGTTVAAGSVVTQSLPANCLAAGSPARVIRYFDPEAHDSSSPTDE